MPDPFFDDLEKAYLTVVTHPTERITVERGGKIGNVFMHPSDGNVYIRITSAVAEQAENRMNVDMTKREVVS